MALALLFEIKHMRQARNAVLQTAVKNFEIVPAQKFIIRHPAADGRHRHAIAARRAYCALRSTKVRVRLARIHIVDFIIACFL